MTGDLERDVRGLLHDRVAGRPERYEAPPALLVRALRRRRAQRAGIAAGTVLLAAGTVAVVAQASRTGSRQLEISTPARTRTPSTLGSTAPGSTAPGATVPGATVPGATVPGSTVPGATAPGRPSVPTVGCPITYTISGNAFPPPAIAARAPVAGDAAVLLGLVSFAATTDPRYVVLGPEGWRCRATVATDGQNGIAITDPASAGAGDAPTAPIAIVNDFLWHGGVGSLLACSVFDDPAVQQYVTTNFASRLPCRPPGRVLTRVDAHVSEFRDPDGSSGVAWMRLPSSLVQDDGLLSVLTCRPAAGLTAADCAAVIADFRARLDPAAAG